MGESLCKGLCPLHPQPPLGTVDGFALQERECSQGFKGGDFRQKNQVDEEMKSLILSITGQAAGDDP